MSATTTQIEIEAKYDVADGQAVVPADLLGVGARAGVSGRVASVVAQAPMVLTAVYVDTADLALAAARTTLRQRSGGTDDGWHLKLPLADGARLEVHRPLGRTSTPPAALTSLVAAVTRGSRLQPVATLVNHRTVHHLLDADGRVLAELADDSVTGTRHADGHVVTWRELEVELVDGDRALLAALDKAVRGAGIAPAGGPSKVARVLPAPTTRPATGALADLVGADPMVRLDRPGGATLMHAALRRLQALQALQRRADRPALAARSAKRLADRAALVGRLVAVEAAVSSLRALVADEPSGLLTPVVARRIERGLVSARRVALTAVRRSLSDSEQGLLLDALAAADLEAAAVSAVSARKAARRASRGTTAETVSEALTAGASTGSTGGKAARVHRVLTKLDRVLTEAHALDTGREVLATLAAAPGATVRDGVTLGRLDKALQDRRAATASTVARLRAELVAAVDKPGRASKPARRAD